MKKIIFLLPVLFAIALSGSAQKKTFMRLYDHSEHLLYKGYFAGTTDTSILIIKHDTTVITVPISQVGSIKTKRTVGHTILMTSIVGGITGGVLGGISSSSGSSGNNEPVGRDQLSPNNFNVLGSYTTADGIIGGFIIGAAAGALIGAIAGLAKNSRVFVISGRKENWIQVKSTIDKIPVYKKTAISSSPYIPSTLE